MTCQDKDFNWFTKNNTKLFKKYGEKYLAIKNKKVIGSFNDLEEAVEKTKKNHALGTFIIQKCGKDDSVYTNHIVSLWCR